MLVVRGVWRGGESVRRYRTVHVIEVPRYYVRW